MQSPLVSRSRSDSTPTASPRRTYRKQSQQQSHHQQQQQQQYLHLTNQLQQGLSSHPTPPSPTSSNSFPSSSSSPSSGKIKCSHYWSFRIISMLLIGVVSNVGLLTRIRTLSLQEDASLHQSSRLSVEFTTMPETINNYINNRMNIDDFKQDSLEARKKDTHTRGRSVTYKTWNDEENVSITHSHGSQTDLSGHYGDEKLRDSSSTNVLSKEGMRPSSSSEKYADSTSALQINLTLKKSTKSNSNLHNTSPVSIKTKTNDAATPSRKAIKKGKIYPPLNKLIKDNTTGIIGDVSFLLDFAILGHAKCATSFLMEWLSENSEQVHIWDYEVCDLYDHKPAELVSKLYNDFYLPTAGHDQSYYKRGFKCPGHFSKPALRYFHDNFPKAVLIVGLRHPVHWFESFYNFRVRKRGYNITLHKLFKETGEFDCPPESAEVCTRNAQFHVNLAKFGKTDWKSKREQALLNMPVDSMRTIHNPIFLYDLAQFHDADPQRKSQLRKDIQNFIGLDKELGTKEQHVSSRGPKYKAMNICDDQYLELRKELVEVGTKASQWISKYFITLPDVTVSSRSYFEQILQTYRFDPCSTNITEHLLLHSTKVM